jgi:hypothetical protein
MANFFVRLAFELLATATHHRKKLLAFEPNNGRTVSGIEPETEKIVMRVATIATILLLSSSLVPSFAQDQGQSQAQAPTQPQTVPVQPERSPSQSQQSRQDDRDQAENSRIGRDWRARPRDGDRMGGMDQNDMRDKRRNDMDTEHSTVGRDWRAHRDDDRADRDGYGRGYYDEDRPRRRVKVCVEYENGDEYCRYR